MLDFILPANITLNIVVQPDADLKARLDRIESAIAALAASTRERMDAMTAEVDRLATEVTETNTVIDSAIALIKGLAQQIRDAAGDPAKLTELADSLDAKQAELAAAVAANTPVAPTP